MASFLPVIPIYNDVSNVAWNEIFNVASSPRVNTKANVLILKTKIHSPLEASIRAVPNKATVGVA